MSRRYHIWTPEEDAFLRENGYLGAERCAREFNRAFGHSMTKKAVSRHANRRLISLTKYGTCSMCGKPVEKDKPDGLCRVCHERSLATPASEQRAALMKRMHYTPEEEAAIEEASRERARMRQRKHREKTKT